ncbi:sulfite exporter TauE/SafE family protein [Candidatus Gottesmanbacteria bacterium]|nr:sulfite exporter TauE/SafE family protein [Candidatus Gottesmanbacteria bacterium]
MNTQKVYIKGMHCRSCEILIEDELKKIHGVNSVSVNHQTGVADVDCECELDDQEVASAVESAGYSIGQDGKVHFFSRNQRDYIDLGIAFFIATTIFLIAKTLGIFNLSSSISGSYSSLLIVFLVGLTAGVSTCMALVGGLVLGASARFSAQFPHATKMEKFKPHIFFNLGRIASYVVLGGLIGYAGSLFQLSTSVLGMLTVAVGLVMLLLGGQLIDIFPILKKISFTLPKGLHRMLGIKEKTEEQYSNKNAAVMGAMTFFLPCGFTQAMQLYAMSTGSPVTGALTMGVFALGTAPGLLGVGGLTSVIKGGAAKLFFKTAGVVVITLAFFNVSNGLNLLGVPQVFGAFSSNATAANSGQDPNVLLVNGVQVVRMVQGASGYTPNRFTIKKGIPVRWIVTSKDIYSCASSIVSQDLGIRKGLELGENVFNFTPTKTGAIRFSCVMGMYNGSFNVVDENTDTVSLPLSPTPTSQIVNSAPASCGAGGGGCGCGGGVNKAAIVQNDTQPPGKTVIEGNVQILKAIYTGKGDISPNRFTVNAKQPVRFEIEAKDDGQGCMGSVTIPSLTKKVEVFTKGKTTVFEFTPDFSGPYKITCAMGIPRGEIQVN